MLVVAELSCADVRSSRCCCCCCGCRHRCNIHGHTRTLGQLVGVGRSSDIVTWTENWQFDRPDRRLRIYESLGRPTAATSRRSVGRSDSLTAATVQPRNEHTDALGTNHLSYSSNYIEYRLRFRHTLTDIWRVKNCVIIIIINFTALSVKRLQEKRPDTTP